MVEERRIIERMAVRKKRVMWVKEKKKIRKGDFNDKFLSFQNKKSIYKKLKLRCVNEMREYKKIQYTKLNSHYSC